jgi:TRAP-type C4-dicarboxylate transport system permease small subunit
VSTDKAPPPNLTPAVTTRAPLIERIDRAIYQGERQLAWILFLGMGVLTFIAVVHRVFSRGEGRLSGLALRWFGHPDDPASKAFFHGPLSTTLNLTLGFVMCLIAVRTVKRSRPLGWPQSLLRGAILTASLALAIKLILVLLPNGLVWSGKVSLAMMLWVGFLGASMATYEKRHLAVEMGEKIWPKKLLPHVRALACGLTALACAFLFLLSWISTRGHLAGWQKNHHVDVLDPTALPFWLIFAIFLWTFGIMALRFVRQGVRAITHPEEGGQDPLAGLGGTHEVVEAEGRPGEAGAP